MPNTNNDRPKKSLRNFNFKINWRKVRIVIGIILLSCLLLLIVFRIGWVNFIDKHEVATKFDRRTGTLTVLKKTGYIVNPPFLVSINTFDLRPKQVCINANNRVLNCKLVRLNPNGLELFIKWHGLDSGDNVSNILKSYAYDGRNKTYPFLDIITELGAQQSTANQTE